MSDGVELLTRGVIIGMGAAALMDAWALFAVAFALALVGIVTTLIAHAAGLRLPQ